MVEFAARRRVRVNGTLIQAGQRRMVIKVEQAYGNCPQYIQQRVSIPERLTRPGAATCGTAAPSRPRTSSSSGARTPSSSAPPTPNGAATPLTGAANQGLSASTATSCGGPITRATTCSTARQPRHRPETALLFLDFTTGRTLQLTGRRDRVERTRPARRRRAHRPARPLHAPATRRRPAAGRPPDRLPLLPAQSRPHRLTPPRAHRVILPRPGVRCPAEGIKIVLD